MRCDMNAARGTREGGRNDQERTSDDRVRKQICLLAMFSRVALDWERRSTNGYVCSVLSTDSGGD